MSIPATQIQLIKTALLEALPTLKLIYLFGSQAKGTANGSSDWDIAVLPQGPLDNTLRWDLAQNLASKLGLDVDLVDLSGASTVLQMQVVNDGQLLMGDRQEADVFETQVFSMYAHLQESRQDIVDEFVGSLKHEFTHSQQTLSH